MIDPHQVQGKFYEFIYSRKSYKFRSWVVNKPLDGNIGLGLHHVLCLGIVPGREDYVKVMPLRGFSKTCKRPEVNGEYLPIRPSPKDDFPIRIRITNKMGGFYDYWHWVRRYAHLNQYEYLRIDIAYEVPIEILKELKDQYGSTLSIRAKHQGGLAELINHVRLRDQVREEERVRRRVIQDREKNRQDWEREETFLQAIKGMEILFSTSEIQNNDSKVL
ncbi:hypothetical protein NHQ30_004860 [Ciborinia camelliae]|nr:hypothetical protein NHQ30_004860 [Ciborinia camelliae]